MTHQTEGEVADSPCVAFGSPLLERGISPSQVKDKGGEIEKMDKSKAIELLKQALTDIPKLRKLHYNNQEFKLWCAKVETIIKEGLDADDYERLAFVQSKYFLDELGIDLSLEDHSLPKLNDYETALKSVIQKHETLGVQAEPAAVAKFEDTTGLPIQIFDKMQFHPKVIQVSEYPFKTGNYSSAIFEAFKAVHNYVQDKTGLTLDGVNLMEKVFNENKPILQLNELLTKSDRDEQKGFKYLFMGSQMGIRNPQAHEIVKPEEQNRALEYLGIASLLMRIIDGSKLVKLNI